MTEMDFTAAFEKAKSGPAPAKQVASLTKRVMEKVSGTRWELQDTQPLLNMAEYLADKPGQTSLALQVAEMVHIYSPDEALADEALALWKTTFDKLPNDKRKMGVLSRMAGGLTLDTPLEKAYTEKWDALPDSPAKRDATKTPEFYAGLRAKFEEYGVSHIDSKLQDIAPLKYDTRGWSDFVQEALQATELGKLFAEKAMERNFRVPVEEVDDAETRASWANLQRRLKAEGLLSDEPATPADKQQDGMQQQQVAQQQQSHPLREGQRVAARSWAARSQRDKKTLTLE